MSDDKAKLWHWDDDAVFSEEHGPAFKPSQIDLIESALEEGDSEAFVTALNALARARGMSEIARRTGFGRETLYRSLDGNPKIGTVLKVMQALNLQLTLRDDEAADESIDPPAAPKSTP